jgi:hypothetical protein
MSDVSRLMRECQGTTEMQSMAELAARDGQSARGDQAGRNGYFTRSNSFSRARRNEWSSADVRRLRELASSGTPVHIIAATLQRTTSAVRNKAGMHGISLRMPR